METSRLHQARYERMQYRDSVTILRVDLSFIDTNKFRTLMMIKVLFPNTLNLLTCIFSWFAINAQKSQFS